MLPTTTVRGVDARSPDPRVISEAAELIRAGKLVAFPTETVYGLGANALDTDAVTSIFRAKGRPSTNPLIAHVAEVAQARELTSDWSDLASVLAEHFWPGPLTLVLRRGPGIPDVLTAGGSTVAVRCPEHPVARSLIRSSGVPIAAPSANRSGQLSPTTADHVQASLGSVVDLILDAGPAWGGLESTVLDLSDGVPTILRPGLIAASELEAIVGPVRRRAAPIDGEPARSPGMLSRHYAPRTPLELFESVEQLRERERALSASGERSASLSFRDGDPRAVASRLYADLHAADAQAIDRVLALLPPDEERWAAVRDRLTRAACR